MKFNDFSILGSLNPVPPILWDRRIKLMTPLNSSDIK